MKRLLLTGVAALFLATGTAHADPKTLPPMQKYEPGHVFELDDDDKRMLSLYPSHNQMPPEKYDFPYEDTLFIQDGYDLNELNEVSVGTGEFSSITTSHSTCNWHAERA